MKRILNVLFMLLLLVSTAFGQAQLSMDGFKIEAGETKEILIDMTSVQEDIVTVGGIISLPDGLSFEKAYNRNRAYIELTDRKDDHTVSTNILSDGSLKFLITSLTLSPFFDTSGPLFKITVTAAEEALLGEKTISLKNIEITTDAVEYRQDTFEASVNIYKNFNLNASSANESMGSVEGSGIYESGTQAVLTATAVTGYHFEKWSDDTTDNPYTITVNDDMDIEALFAPNKYTVTFVDGETTVATGEYDYGSIIKAPDAPEKEGYTFDGWFCGDIEFVEGYKVPLDGIVFTAKYSVNVYTVTYVIDEEVIKVVEVEFGSKLPEAPEAPTREGYIFVGWSEAPEYMPAEDIVIVGTYKKVTGITTIINENAEVDVYTFTGLLFRSKMHKDEINQLPAGIYIINHQKVIVK